MDKAATGVRLQPFLDEPSSTVLPLSAIRSNSQIVIYSERNGILSEHNTIMDATIAFYEYVKKLPKVNEFPKIYRRETAGWMLI